MDPRTAIRSRSPHLVLVGGGHAMLPLVKHAGTWTARGVAITLVDESDALFYSGMVPEHLGGVYASEQVRVDLRRLCAASGVAFTQSRVTGLSLDPPGVVLASGETLPCDLAALDVGGVNPKRDAAGDAIPTKPLHHIEALERFVRDALDRESGTQHLAIVGGGAAGVEVALNVSARVGATRPDALRLTLFEPADSLLPNVPAGMQREALRLLEQRGVTVTLSTRVEAAENGEVVLADGTRIAADRVLWATGTAGPPLFRESGLPVDDAGFLRVADTMQCPSAPWLFAAGDCAALDSYPDLKKIGVNAVKQGPLLRDNIARALDALLADRSLGDLDLSAFTPYPLTPLILSTGEPEGLWVSGRLWLRGGPILRLKHTVDRRWMRKYSPAWRRRPLLDLFDREAAATDRASTSVS
ncbi:MAG: FAD-dependent oxidoreductase [Rhodothermales bacterium]